MPNSLALQLHSLRHEAAVNAEDVVRSVPSLGFDAIETAEAYGWSADQWKNILTETKLRILGAHVGLETLEKEWDSQINFQRAIGNERLVVTALPRNLQTPEGYSEAAGRLNSLGDRAKSAGFALLYHNHAYEFLPFADGRCGMDILLAETDPQLVSFEVDTYWVERGGRDSREFIEQNISRIGLLHAKEFRRDGRDVPAGEGDVDWKVIVPLLRSRGCPIIVEYEADNPVEAVAASARYLRKL
jgi:sugar phosphate isomerase/epimerase